MDKPIRASVPDQMPHVPLKLGVRIGNLIAVLLPFGGLLIAIYELWGRGFSWVQLGLFLGMYALTGLGITIGYHRLFTHRAFDTFRPLKLLLAITGSMAVQGPLLKWVATHRRHHQHSDEEDDPHSPHRYGDGLLSVVRGLWHAHVGWLFNANSPNLRRYVGDLSQDRAIERVDSLFFLWVLVGLAIPTAAGGILLGTWAGALTGLIWGGLVRIFFVHHVTWSVNSVCHFWGSRPFACGDESRNNLLFGVLAWGEGWHNNHHAFPTSARHGLRWWQLDISYLTIRLMAILRLAWDVRVPKPEAIALRQKLTA